MAPEDEQPSMARVESLIAAWQEGLITDAEKDALSDLLRGSSTARMTFLEYAQIEADLRWKCAAQAQTQQLLDRQGRDDARPVASIVEAGVSYRSDPAFAEVFREVAENEAVAQAWLQAYPRVRAYACLMIPHTTGVEEVVSAVGRDLLPSCTPEAKPDRFLSAAYNLTRRHCQAYLQNAGLGSRVACCDVAEACLGGLDEFDAVALYDTIESLAPHELPGPELRLLTRRYMNGQTPEQIAAQQGNTVRNARFGLAKARLLVWKGANQLADQDEIDHLLLANTLLDQSSPPAEALSKLKRWLKQSGRHATQLASFAVLHESLYRQLSLYRLLEEMTVRQDRAFTQQIEAAVRELESLAAQATPRTPTLPRPHSRVPIGALAALAAGVLLALTLAFGGRRDSRQTAQAPPPVVERETTAPPRTAPPEEAAVAPPEPVLPPVVASVREAFAVGSDGSHSFERGALVRAGEEVVLERGYLELETLSHGVWVLEAPVAVVFGNDREAMLRRGKLTGMNAGTGKPLVVSTPTTRVVDLGTEFGVSVRDDHSTYVAVYDGEVELQRSVNRSNTPADSRSLQAGYQAEVTPRGAAPEEFETLPHDREFVRVDEMALRRFAQEGSVEAAERVAFYELMRIKGLVAYQGFHEPSRGAEFTFGFKKPGLRFIGRPAFGANLGKRTGWQTRSASLEAAPGRTCFLDFDTSEGSVLERLGLLDDANQLGGQAGELWIAWRTRAILPPAKNSNWAGLSLMFGNQRMSNEPLFIGKPTETTNYAIKYFKQDVGQDEERADIDFDTQQEGVQAREVDQEEHLWVLKIKCQKDFSDLDLWCDIDPAELSVRAPNTRKRLTNLRFDRFRMEVEANDRSCRWAFDEVAVATKLSALEAFLTHP